MLRLPPQKQPKIMKKSGLSSLLQFGDYAGQAESTDKKVR